MRVNTDVLVEAILMSHNLEHDAQYVHLISFWLERTSVSKADRIANVSRAVNHIPGTSDILRRMHCIQAFAHIISYGK